MSPVVPIKNDGRHFALMNKNTAIGSDVSVYICKRRKRFMNKILSLLLIMTLWSVAAFAETPGTRLGLKILSNMEAEGENCFVSPVSLAYALSMVAAGAEPETQEEIMKVLEMRSLEEISNVSEKLSESGIKLANAVYGKPELNIKTEYMELIREKFDGEWFSMGENAMDEINQWVKNHTDNMIDGIFAETPKMETMMALMNAISMDAEWLCKFDPENTKMDVFHTPDGDVEAPFMYRQLQTDYDERDGVQKIRLRYAGGELAMLLAMPTEGKMKNELAALAEKGLDYFDFSIEGAKVELRLPKLDISMAFSAKEFLEKEGVNRVFEKNGFLSGISDQPVYVSDILQKLRLQVEEAGTKAAAATAVVMAMGAAPSEEKVYEMTLDRPFLLAIVHEPTQTVCFAGIVVNPTK